MRTVAATLLVDLHGAEAIAALDQADVPCIVLKGRAFAELLYPREARPYDDTDLLVPAARRASAEATLRALGYIDRTAGTRHEDNVPRHSHHWVRPRDDARIDLHVRFAGTLVETERVWSVLSDRTVELSIGGRSAYALDRPASALICALHHASHPLAPKALGDLERALAVIDDREWEIASELASQLGADEAFIAGLRLSPQTRSRADALGLPRALSTARMLEIGGAGSPSRKLERIRRHPTVRARLVAIIHVLVPTQVAMRKFEPLARRGRAGLIAAYCLRPLRLLALAPGALWTWARASRQARATAASDQRR